MKTKIGYTYKCPECNYEEVVKTKWRGMECKNCEEGTMRRVFNQNE